MEAGILNLGRSRLFLYSTIVTLSVVITLMTGLLLWARIVSPFPAVAYYGLPFGWREVWNYSSQNATTNWSTGFFSFDVIFYAAIGYIAVFPYQRRYRTMSQDNPLLGLSIAYVLTVLVITILLHGAYCEPVSRTCG